MAMREESDIPRCSLRHAADDPPSPVSDFVQRFALHDGRQPNGPVRRVLADVERCAALVHAVVPFAKIIIDQCSREASEPAGFPRAIERAGPYVELQPVQCVSEIFGRSLALIRERCRRAVPGRSVACDQGGRSAAAAIRAAPHANANFNRLCV